MDGAFFASATKEDGRREGDLRKGGNINSYVDSRHFSILIASERRQRQRDRETDNKRQQTISILTLSNKPTSARSQCSPFRPNDAAESALTIKMPRPRRPSNPPPPHPPPPPPPPPPLHHTARISVEADEQIRSNLNEQRSIEEEEQMIKEHFEKEDFRCAEEDRRHHQEEEQEHEDHEQGEAERCLQAMTDPFFIALSDVVADNEVAYEKLFGERQQSSIDTDNNLLTTLYNATKNHLKYAKDKTEGVDYCLPTLEEVTQHILQHQCISNGSWR